MIDPQEYFLATTNPMEEKIAHIFEIYRKELFKANALDFDDLLLETVRLLKVLRRGRANATTAVTNTSSSTSTRTPTARSTS